MAKIFNAVLMLTGILMLLAFAGFPTMTHELMSYTGLTTTDSAGQITDVGISGNDILASGLIVAVLAIFAVSAATSGGITIGTFSINTTDSKIVALFASALMGYVMLDLYSILRIANESFVGADGLAVAWIKVLVFLIIVPLIFAIAVAMVQWWRGADI